MLRTLFLQAPSFDGFDGGAGSRYQAKREIRSYWFPTWLAQPAALVENSKLIDAPPADIKLPEVVAQAGDFDLCILHTSVPSFDSDVKCAEALKAANPKLKIGMIGAKVAVKSDESLHDAPVIDFVAQERVRLHHQGGGRRPAVVVDPRPLLSQRGRQHRPQPGSPDPGGDGLAALGDRRLQARPEDRGLLHRLSEAPLHLGLHRAGLQEPLHLLPLAADRGRAPLSHPQRRKRGGGNPPR